MEAKKAAGYFAPQGSKQGEELQKVKGREIEEKK
jgi:hypothetical protein